MKEILCLGNEFIAIDSLAKKVGSLLKEDFIVHQVNDSFQLMSLLNSIEKPIILDIVKNLKDVRIIPTEKLKSNNIVSAHDFDASYIIKLLDKPVKIIGIPEEGNKEEISDQVRELIDKIYNKD